MGVDIIIVVIVEIIFYLFHLSVLIFLVTKRKASFAGPFYSIFRLVLVGDLFTCLAVRVFINIVFE